MEEIKNLPLHDGLLDSIVIKWSKGVVEFHFSVFSEKGKSAQPHLLKFLQVSELNVPHTSPWGESGSVNSIDYENGICKIQIQSGDDITIKAEGYSFVLKKP